MKMPFANRFSVCPCSVFRDVPDAGKHGRNTQVRYVSEGLNKAHSDISSGFSDPRVKLFHYYFQQNMDDRFVSNCHCRLQKRHRFGGDDFQASGVHGWAPIYGAIGCSPA